MTALPSQLDPLGAYFNLTGLGLTQGTLWIGDENTDPEDFPKEVFWDVGGTDTATQPLAVEGGYVRNAGAPARWYTSGPYSIRAKDSQDNLIFYLASVPNLVDTGTPGPWPFPMALTQPTDVTPSPNQWLGGIDVPWAMQLPAALLGASGWAFTAPSGASFTATLRLNSINEDHTTGTAVGTMVWADGANAPTFTSAGGVTVDLPTGSRLDWYAQADDSTNINGLKWTWIGYVQGDGSGAFANLVTEPELTAAVAELQAQIDTLTASVAAIQGYDIGDMKWFAGPSANLPSGWYALDSASAVVLNISAYPALYAKISTTWGGDGLTTFALPPSGRYPRMAISATFNVGDLLDNALESHNHADGASFTTGSPRPGAFGDTSNATGGSFPASATVHTDANTGSRLLYTSVGSPAAGSGSGTAAGNFDTETRPDTAVFTCAVWTGIP